MMGLKCNHELHFVIRLMMGLKFNHELHFVIHLIMATLTLWLASNPSRGQAAGQGEASLGELAK
jgi:hypothetical protein